MSDLKTIKISKETYAELNEIAGELQAKLKRPVSIDEAMRYLLKDRIKGRKISDLADTWNISDQELQKVKSSIGEAWKRWVPLER